MRADRPAKNAIRLKWVDVLKSLGEQTGAHPCYLTLPGAEGRDVDLLIKEGLISTTETGAIAEKSAKFCVAVENSPKAVLNLQRRFPGLLILEQDIKGVLHGDSVLAYPVKAHKEYCQAHVVNLDLQQTLDGEFIDDKCRFPVLRWIEKFGNLHLECPHRSWHLLLTLNATIQWSSSLCRWVSDFLRDNFEKVEAFRDGASRLLAPEVFRAIVAGETVAFGELQLPMRQRILLVVVPKAIGESLSKQGWEITTKLNAEYRGADGAPMVTFIFGLNRITEYRRHERLYVDAISQCLSNVQQVNQRGDIVNIVGAGACEA